MPANNDRAYKDSYNLVAYLNQANRAGLSDTVIAAITSIGTIAKLKTAIAAIVMPERQKYIQRKIPPVIDRANRSGVFLDADVETARAAGTFAALITAIIARQTTVDSKAQVHVSWAL